MSNQLSINVNQKCDRLLKRQFDGRCAAVCRRIQSTLLLQAHIQVRGELISMINRLFPGCQSTSSNATIADE
jgi:hypothetical protein